MAKSQAVQLQIAFPPMETLADLFAAIEQEFGPASRRSGEQARQLFLLRSSAGVIQKVLHKHSIRDIGIDEITAFGARLSPRIKLLKESGFFARHSDAREFLLEKAHRLGWTSPRYEIFLQWYPVFRAVRYSTLNECRQVIDDAIANAISPDDYSDDDLAKWKEKQLKQRCSPTATDRAARNLRYAIRRGGFAERFPLLDVSLHSKPSCCIPWEEMPPNLAEQIKTIHSWFTVECPPELRKRQTTATSLLWALRALSSFALQEPGGSVITDIREVITEEYVNYWVKRRQEKGNLPDSIITHLRRLSALTKQYYLFEQGDYHWLEMRINSIVKEPKWKKRERKRQLLVAPHLVSAIPSQIRAERQARKNLTPKEVAWSVHDELFMSMPPWRSVNHAGIDRVFNVLETELTDDLFHKVTHIPSWVQEELANNEERQFLIIHFPEDVMKGKKPIWEILDREIEPLYRDYVENHRPVLSPHDPGALFLGRDGYALRRGGLRRLVAELTARYLPKRISHHKRRDCIAIATVAAGGSYKEVGAMLHHYQGGSHRATDEYLAALPVVGCAEALEREVEAIAAAEGLDFS